MHNSWCLFLIPLTDHLNVGREIYSIGISLNVLFSGLGAPLFGALADKYGYTIKSDDLYKCHSADDVINLIAGALD